MKTIILLSVFISTLSQAQNLVVEQGSIGRWGEGSATKCLYLGKTYDAIEGHCYYPVDMDRRPAYYEIGMVSGGVLEFTNLEVKEKACVLESIEFPDNEYVTLSQTNRDRHWTEQWQVKSIFKKSNHLSTFTLPLEKPVKPLPAADNFGVCREFNGIKKHRHTGVDYPIGSDNPVHAVADATVVLAVDHFFTGKAVYLDHGNGLVTMYFHLNKLEVEPGQTVKVGEIIGLIGSTGRSTGPHLHIGARWFNQRINPNLLFEDPSTFSKL